MTKTYATSPMISPDTIVICCSSSRFQPAFKEFIKDQLGLSEGDYIPFILPGAGGGLARPNILPKDFKIMKERLELLQKEYKSVRRVVIINHEDCAYYRSLKDRVPEFIRSFHSHVSQDDMKVISQVFANLLSHLKMQLECYYAKFADADHTQVTFEKVN